MFKVRDSVSRGSAAPSRHLHESSPGDEVVGGRFFYFGAVRTDLTEMLRAGRGVVLERIYTCGARETTW